MGRDGEKLGMSKRVFLLVKSKAGHAAQGNAAAPSPLSCSSDADLLAAGI